MSMIANYLRISPEQLEALRKEPSAIMDLLDPDDRGHAEGAHLDIDKAWQAIHFLLTGDPWEGKLPLRNAVMGGAALGEEDVGYGPARGLTPAEVRSVSVVLASISGERLGARFDASKFAEAEIYPSGWSADDQAFIVQHYEALRAFFAEAARAGDAMVLYLN